MRGSGCEGPRLRGRASLRGTGTGVRSEGRVKWGARRGRRRRGAVCTGACFGSECGIGSVSFLSFSLSKALDTREYKTRVRRRPDCAAESGSTAFDSHRYTATLAVLWVTCLAPGISRPSLECARRLAAPTSPAPRHSGVIDVGPANHSLRDPRRPPPSRARIQRTHESH